MEYKNLSLLELEEYVKSGNATYTDIYQYFLSRAKQYQESLNVFVTSPKEISQVTGLPIAVKDTYCEVGVRSTAGSKMLSDFVSPYESTVTDRLKKGGFVSF